MQKDTENKSILETCRDYLLSCLKQGNENILFFNEHEAELRKCTGYTFKDLEEKTGMSGQSLNRFEIKKSFPVIIMKPLINEFIKKAIEFKNSDDSLLSSLYDYIHSKFHFYDYASEIPIFESDYINLTISKNISNFRTIMKMKPDEMAKLLGIEKKELYYIEKYTFIKNNSIPLKENQVCSVINELFDFLSEKTEEQSNTDCNFELNIIAGLFLDLSAENLKNDYSKDREKLQELFNDYCISQKYEQSDLTVNFIKEQINELTKTMVFKAIARQKIKTRQQLM